MVKGVICKIIDQQIGRGSIPLQLKSKGGHVVEGFNTIVLKTITEQVVSSNLTVSDIIFKREGGMFLNKIIKII